MKTIVGDMRIMSEETLSVVNNESGETESNGEHCPATSCPEEQVVSDIVCGWHWRWRFAYSSPGRAYTIDYGLRWHPHRQAQHMML